MAKPETITSAANPLLKDVRRAISRGSLTEQGWCVAETFHLLEEALRSPCELKTVLASQTALAAVEAHLRRLPVRVPVKLLVLPDPLLASLAATETSQGVIALVQPPEWRLEQLFPAASGSPTLVVLLDGLQDPGNAGAIVRAAEAFGATGVLFLKGTVSPFNSKTLRASAGSLFRVPFLHGVDAAMARAALQHNHVELFAAVPQSTATEPAATEPTPTEPRPSEPRPSEPRPLGSVTHHSPRPLTSVDLTVPCAFIIGSEAHGVSRQLRASAIDVTIPTVGVESLNAAVAAGILLYEARRQRVPRP